MMAYEDSLSFKSTLEDAILALSGDVSMDKSFLERAFHESKAQYESVMNFLKKNDTNILSKEDVLFSLKKLHEEIGQIKPVDLTIAVEPDDKFKKAVFDWISQNIKKPILPRYTVDPSLVGGAKITYNGIFLDLGLRNKIDELPIFKRKI